MADTTPSIWFPEEDASTRARHQIVPILHSLAGNPLFEKDSLVELAKFLPKDNLVRHHPGRVPRGQNMNTIAQDLPGKGDLLTAIENIDDSGAYVFLGDIQRHPDYSALVDECLSSLYPLIEDSTLVVRRAWIFLSAPRSNCAFHRDPDNGLLMQVRGRKRAWVWDPRDPVVCSEEQNERYHACFEQTPWEETHMDRARAFDLTPGDGAYMPYTAPHMAENFDEVSCTISITYETRANHRLRNLYRVNHALRRLGWNPSTPGKSPARDFLLYQGDRFYRRAKRGLFRRSANSA